MTTYQVSQETANKLLYQAWKEYKTANMYLENMRDDWYITHNERGKAYYNVWSMVTGFKFEFGYYELSNLTEDDFHEVIEAEQREQLEEFEACEVAFLL